MSRQPGPLRAGREPNRLCLCRRPRAPQNQGGFATDSGGTASQGRGRAAPAPPGHRKWHSGTDTTPLGTACPAPGSTCSSPAPVFPSSPFFPPTSQPASGTDQSRDAPHVPTAPQAREEVPGQSSHQTCHFWKKSYPFPTKTTAAEPLCVPRQSHRANTDPADRPPAREHSDTGSSAALLGMRWVPAEGHGSLRSHVPAPPAPQEPKPRVPRR